MGNCVSPQHQTIEKGGSIDKPSTTKIIHLDGKLQEFKQPIKAGHILSQNLKSFLCSSESMYVDCHVPHVPHDEDLQLGQLYFLIPLSHSNAPLSLHDLCDLAIKASASLAKITLSSFSNINGNDVRPPEAETLRRCCPTGNLNVIGLKSQVGRSNQRI